ncbi:AMME syndrome candidate protein 1 protein [Perkinsus chesapeaki]|uniref:AMME syndrome candidate protein 1 protein n=1 Tax=Perkinsus chesapeaki TaxID=330153 RepID=A0A7J6MZU5_PERCH|nr:AMME syndrome candidate protein 1 protein [Perkinsus chesapeaki]
MTSISHQSSTGAVHTSTPPDLLSSQQLCAYCFDVLRSYYKLDIPTRMSRNLEDYLPDMPECLQPDTMTSGIFVTWDTRSRGSSLKSSQKDYRTLRGCIGYLLPIKLGQLKKYTIISSQEDRRFRPIAQSELQNLMCTVSVLHSFEDLEDDIYNWSPDGTHGIVVTFTLPGESKTRSATFLPNVMPEQRWDQQEAVKRAIMKGGGSSRDAQHPQGLHTTVQRYQSSNQNIALGEQKEVSSAAYPRQEFVLQVEPPWKCPFKRCGRILAEYDIMAAESLGASMLHSFCCLKAATITQPSIPWSETVFIVRLASLRMASITTLMYPALSHRPGKRLWLPAKNILAFARSTNEISDELAIGEVLGGGVIKTTLIKALIVHFKSTADWDRLLQRVFVQRRQDLSTDKSTVNSVLMVLIILGAMLFATVAVYSAYVAWKSHSLRAEIEPCEKFREEVRAKWAQLVESFVDSPDGHTCVDITAIMNKYDLERFTVLLETIATALYIPPESIQSFPSTAISKTSLLESLPDIPEMSELSEEEVDPAPFRKTSVSKTMPARHARGRRATATGMVGAATDVQRTSQRKPTLVRRSNRRHTVSEGRPAIRENPQTVYRSKRRRISFVQPETSAARQRRLSEVDFRTVFEEFARDTEK